jgi:predicted Zn-dependent protease
MLAALLAVTLASQARAQDADSLIRDTETERLLRSYLDPILVAAGLQPKAVGLFIIADPSINAFVTEGQNVFVNTGLIMQLETPNQVTGVLAHETGHMADGHLVRSNDAVTAATIPMLIGMAAGVAAMAAGSGDAGQALILGGQQIAERDILAFSRTQESAADQAGIRLLNATHQSGQGMLQVFRQFSEEEIVTDKPIDAFAQNHPLSVDRIASLQRLVDSSPYRDVKDSAAAQYAYDMVRAKLRGYLGDPAVVLRQYPLSDTSKPARYARAMAYFRQPNMEKALSEIQSLLAEEPNNPYFLEVYGQIQVERSHPELGVEPYRKAVAALPDAPLLRMALGGALLATEKPEMNKEAIKELQISLQQENNNSFTWYELAQAYGHTGETGKADLATAEQYYSASAYQQAMQFAARAQRNLPRGSIDWQRANDIMSVASNQIPKR